MSPVGWAGAGRAQPGEEINDAEPGTLIELPRYSSSFPFTLVSQTQILRRKSKPKVWKRITFSNEEQQKMLSVVEFLIGKMCFLFCRT